MSDKPKRKTPRIQPSTVYLGAGEERKRREKSLDDLARTLNVKNRSVLIQQIADGELLVIPKNPTPNA